MGFLSGEDNWNFNLLDIDYEKVKANGYRNQ